MKKLSKKRYYGWVLKDSGEYRKKEFTELNTKNEYDKAEITVYETIEVLNDRGGFDHWWDDIDTRLQGEIMTAIYKKILKV